MLLLSLQVRFGCHRIKNEFHACGDTLLCAALPSVNGHDQHIRGQAVSLVDSLQGANVPVLSRFKFVEDVSRSFVPFHHKLRMRCVTCAENTARLID